MSGGGWRWWVGLGAIALAIVAGLAWFAESVAGLDDRDDRIRFVYGIALVVFLLAAGAVRWRRRPSLVLGHALIWVAVGVVLVLGYSFRFELGALSDRLVGELSPSRGMSAGTESVSFRAGADGHFRVAATVDGAALRMMVDSGASLVVLTPADARRIGIDPDALTYGVRFSTANGTAMGALVRIREIRIGPIAVRDVRGAVTRGGLNESLLGQSFLERLSTYTVRNQTLTLHR